MLNILKKKRPCHQRDIIKRLAEMQYQRNEADFRRGTFRVRGDVIDVYPAESSEQALRISGAMKVAAGITTMDEVLKVAPPPSQA